MSDDAERVTADRFFTVLLRNPRFGTAFDRVYGYHIDRGSVAAFSESLRRVAGITSVSEDSDVIVQPANIFPDLADTVRRSALTVPDSVDAGAAAMIAGMIDLRHSDAGRAAAAFLSASAVRENDPVVWWYLGRAQGLMHQWDDAVQSLERAISTQPAKVDRLEIYRELAGALQRNRQFEDARGIWSRIEQDFPGDLRVREQIASTLARDGRWEDALERYLSLARDTRNADQRVQVNIAAGEMLIQLGRREDAIRLLETQLRGLDPESWRFRDIRRRIEDIFRRQQDLRGQASYYENWIAQNPSDTDAMSRLARTLSLLQQDSEAEDWYRKAVQLAPGTLRIREQLADLLTRAQRTDDAITLYQEMSAIDEHNADYPEQWGLLYWTRSDMPLAERQTQAAAVWERLLNRHEDDPVVIVRVAQLMRRAFLTERAIGLYQAAVRLAPDEPQYREILGEYLIQLQRADEAEAVWAEIAAGDRRSKGSLLRLAEILNRFGRTSSAIQAMREACELNPDVMERCRFAEMLRAAAEANRLNSNPSESIPELYSSEEFSRGNDENLTERIFTEAMHQLDLAEQSVRSADEYQAVIQERVKCLVSSGRLDEYVAQLSVKMATAADVSDAGKQRSRMQMLAACYMARDDYASAVRVAEQITELQPQDVSGWTMLTDLYELSGRHGDALTGLRQLMTIDRRGISTHLRRAARLQMRLGQFDAALVTGREIVAASPGSPEAWQFVANLAFEAGRPQVGVDALQMAVRVNPGDANSLRSLAKSLADEFQTSEAIELYWRAYEKAADSDIRMQIISALSNLYLRTSRFEMLIERLEVRNRETQLHTETMRAVAVACREAGAFQRARESLEQLLREDEGDADILRELVDLSVQEQNLSAAVDYQKMILQRSQVTAERQRLAMLLSAAGRIAESDLFAGSEAGPSAGTDGQRSAASLLRIIEQSTTPHNLQEQIDACRTYLDRYPDDWSVRTALAILLYRQGAAEEEVRSLTRSVLNLPLSPLSPGSLQTLPETVTVPLQQIRKVSFPELYNIADNSFSAACCRAVELLLLISDTADQELLRTFFAVGNPARFRDLPIISVADRMETSAPHRDFVFSQFDQLIAGSDGSRKLLLQSVVIDNSLRLGMTSSDTITMLREQVPAAAAKAVIDEPSVFLTNDLSNRLWRLCDSDAKFAENLNSAFRAVPEQVMDERTNAVIAVASLYFRDEPLLKAALDRVSVRRRSPTSQDFWPTFRQLRFVGRQGDMDRVFPETSDPDWLLPLMTLVCRHEEFGGDSWLSTQDPGAQVTPQLLFADTTEVSPLIIQLGRHRTQLAESMRQWSIDSVKDPDAVFRARVQLVLAATASGDEVIRHLIRAASDLPAHGPLRFEIAQRAARQDFLAEATELLDGIMSTDPQARVDIEFRALEWSRRSGNPERARLAASRLFGLPLSVKQQQTLASRMAELGMNDELVALNARLGRGTETRQFSLVRRMQRYLANQENELAGEVAWELLRLASGGSLFSGSRPNDDRDDGGERLVAIRTLGRLGRLQPLIDRYEGMLSASPDSVDLLEILCEFHDAAGQSEKLKEKRDRITRLAGSMPPTLKSQALALENSGDVSAACEVYLQILRDDPVSFSADMETFAQAFERAKRQSDLLKAVLSEEPEIWNDHVGLLINVISTLARETSDSEVVDASIRILLADESARRLAIGGLLARPDVVDESVLVPAVRQELISSDVFSDFRRCNEVFLILQSIRSQHSISFLRDELLSLPGSTVPEKKETSASEETAAMSVAEQDEFDARRAALLMYLEVRLNDEAMVRRYLKRVIAGTPSASSQKNRSAGAFVRSVREDFDHVVPGFALMILNSRLKEQGDHWNPVRLVLLEHARERLQQQQDAGHPARRPPAGSSRARLSSQAPGVVAEDVYQQLADIYRMTGESEKSVRVLDELISMQLTDETSGQESSSDRVRNLLRTAERIQHSGFPIEGARMLLNVTPHDVDDFTRELEGDRAIAFKSRFNASRRWSRQQINPERLLHWFEMQISAAKRRESDVNSGESGANENPIRVDLMLELSGPTDPACRDADLLGQLRLQSVLLSALDDGSLESEELQHRFRNGVEEVLELTAPDLSLLTFAAAAAVRLRSAELLSRLLSIVPAEDEINDKGKDAAGEPESGASADDDSAQSRQGTHRFLSHKAVRIPEALRSYSELSAVLLVQRVPADETASQREVIQTLIRMSADAAQRSGNRLVEIAVLQTCLVELNRHGVRELTDEISMRLREITDLQRLMSPLAATQSIDLRSEIREFLLRPAQ